MCAKRVCTSNMPLHLFISHEKNETKQNKINHVKEINKLQLAFQSDAN